MNTTEELVVLWATADREVALNTVFMYTLNSKRREWWGKVTLIVWGPSARILAEDKQLQSELFTLREAGVKLKACKACADRYNVSAALAQLGLEVVYMGEPLTQMLKAGHQVLTF